MNESKPSSWIVVGVLIVAAAAFVFWTTPAPVNPSCPSCPAKPSAPVKPKASELRIYKTGSCGYCRKLETTLADPAVKSALEGWTVKNVAVDREPVEGVTAVPTYDIYRDGQRVKRGSGYKTPSEFVAWLSAAETESLTTPLADGK